MVYAFISVFQIITIMLILILKLITLTLIAQSARFEHIIPKQDTTERECSAKLPSLAANGRINALNLLKIITMTVLMIMRMIMTVIQMKLIIN